MSGTDRSLPRPLDPMGAAGLSLKVSALGFLELLALTPLVLVGYFFIMSTTVINLLFLVCGWWLFLALAIVPLSCIVVFVSYYAISLPHGPRNVDVVRRRLFIGTFATGGPPWQGCLHKFPLYSRGSFHFLPGTIPLACVFSRRPHVLRLSRYRATTRARLLEFL